MYRLCFALILIVMGCDRICTTVVEDVVEIQNQTSQNLELKVCKGSIYGTQDLIIPTDHNGLFTLKKREYQHARSGKEKCDREENKSSRVSIALTSESFSKVIFCVKGSGSEEKYLILEVGSQCPKGFEAQAEPQDDCEIKED